jgi:hypothetical protein
LVGWASEKKAPLSVSTSIRSPSILPRWSIASSPRKYMSRAKPVEMRLPVLSSIHFTGRPTRIEARVATT